MANPVIDGRVDCSHLIEAHVVRDWRRVGYRAEVRCRCRKIRIAGKRLHGTLDAAERAAEALLMLSKANRK